MEEHAPGKRFYVVFALVAAALLLVGFYVGLTHEWNDNEDATVWFWLLGFLLFGIVGPYAIQYAILRSFGVRHPQRRKWGNNRALLVCAVVLAYVLGFPTAGFIIGLVVPVYLGNFWFALLALQRPEGTLVENSGLGVRFYEPAT